MNFNEIKSNESGLFPIENFIVYAGLLNESPKLKCTYLSTEFVSNPIDRFGHTLGSTQRDGEKNSVPIVVASRTTE